MAIIEVLLKITLKKTLWRFTEFNHVAIDGTIKKIHDFNNTMPKKETQMVVDYYEKWQ